MTPGTFFFAIALLLPPQVEQELQRQRQHLDQVQRQLQEQERQLSRVLQYLEQQEHRANPPQVPACSAEIRLVNNIDPRRMPPTESAVAAINLFSIVSKPADVCLPAEIRVSASYLDSAGNLICSGIVENAARQTAVVQNVHLNIRPWNLMEFVRWRNEPPQTNSGARRLICPDPDGLVESTSDELGRAASVRVRATVLPRAGGMSTAEVQLNLR